MVSWLNLKLAAGQLSSDTLAVLQAVGAAFNITAVSTYDQRLDMVATLAFLVMISPDYLVQK